MPVRVSVGTFGRLRGNRKRSRGNEIFPDRTNNINEVCSQDENMRSPHAMPSKDQNRIGGGVGAAMPLTNRNSVASKWRMYVGVLKWTSLCICALRNANARQMIHRNKSTQR